MGATLYSIADYDKKFHLAMVHMSCGLSPSLRTTDGSKPECIRQF